MVAYPDSSFLVALFLEEAHSPAADRLMTRFGTSLMLTPLHELEFASAVEQAVFRQQLSRVDANAVWTQFREDLSRWVKPLPVDVFSKAVALSKRHTSRLGARSIDVLHVAAALSLKAKVFLTFDERQFKLAEAEGLQVVSA